MERKSREGYSDDEFLLDTSYVLPLVGIEVEGLEEEVYDVILTKKLYYPSVLITELVGVVVKKVKRENIDLPDAALEGFNSVIYGGKIGIVLPEGEDVRIACDLIRAGWSDIFDALLYATAKRLGMRTLSMDNRFRKFLEEHEYDAELLVSHEDAFR